METSSFPIGANRFGSTRHPFRASLPRRVLRQLPRHEPEVADALARFSDAGDKGGPQASRWRVTTQDVKDFLLAYCACLLAAMTFLG